MAQSHACFGMPCAVSLGAVLALAPVQKIEHAHMFLLTCSILALTRAHCCSVVLFVFSRPRYRTLNWRAVLAFDLYISMITSTCLFRDAARVQSCCGLCFGPRHGASMSSALSVWVQR